jgi:hypothetical protein
VKSKALLRIVAPLALLACAETAAAAPLLVTKSATCGCCKHWVEHMRKAGFDVQVREVADVTPTARRLGVPDKLRSCHTSEISGYVIEGHVPAADVKRLLATRPKAAGIAVPGMVVGSPGMEHGDHKEPYQVVLFDKAGNTKVFASH